MPRRPHDLVVPAAAGFVLAATSLRATGYVVPALAAPAGEPLPSAAQMPVLLVVLLVLWMAATGWVLVVASVVRRVPVEWCRRLLAVGVVAAVALFAVAYPVLGAPADDRGNGDEDDALNVLVDALLAGEDAYDETTYLGNGLSPLTGAVLIALPFRVLAGSSAWQVPFLLCVLTIALARSCGSRTALLALVLAGSSAGFAEYYVTGGDYYVSSGLVALAAIAHVRADERPGRAVWATALLLGVASATRASALPVLLLVGALVLRRGATTRRVGALGLAGAVAAALVVPWWLLHRDGFFPFEVAEQIGPPVARAAGVALLLLALAVAARTGRVEVAGPLLALSLLPAVVTAPLALARVVSFAPLGAPALRRLVEETGGTAPVEDGPDPSRPGGPLRDA